MGRGGSGSDCAFLNPLENKWSVLQQVPVVMHVINSV